VARPEPAAAEVAITAAELAARLDALGPFEHRPGLAVAVSGGPDSMALALLARDWAAARDGRILALIVDHGLRPESASESALTRDRLAALGIPSRILAWAGPKPASGVQAAAREARYRLLAAACREAGILHLLVAHQREDQAETVALRQARGSGGAGLAGMPVVREIEGLRLLRPLLDLPRARLRASLVAAGIAWLDDPSNRARRYARAALRGGGDLPVAELLALAERHAVERAADERAAAAWLAARARPHPLGFLRVNLAGIGAPPAGPMLGVLRAVSGRTLPPRRGALERFRARLAAAPSGATLAGCLARRIGDRLTVTREPVAARETIELGPGESRLWDGRFLVALAGAADRRLVLRRLGTPLALDPATRERARRLGIPSSALASLPALWDDGRLLWHPPVDGVTAPGTPAVARSMLAPAMGLAGVAFARPNVVSTAGPIIYLDG
jgi:tRNA(Ile)-lysidine synthase